MNTPHSATPHSAKQQRRLAEVLSELSALYDSAVPAQGVRESRDQARIASLENTVVGLVRPRHWRLRDMRTGGIRALDAVGVSLRDGQLQYGDATWPAAWSFATLIPMGTNGAHQLVIGRVEVKSPVPLRKTVVPDVWRTAVQPEELSAALVLTACINVSSRQRAATFPAGTNF